MGETRPRLRDRPALIATTVGLALAETALVSLLGPYTGLALAPQVSAPTPFDVFHDLRWIIVYTPSWGALAFALVAFVAFRTAVTALVVGRAWPGDLPWPSARALVRRAFLSTVLLTVLLVPWVVLQFATALFSLSWTWIVAVPVLVMISVFVHHSAVTPDWWRIWPTGASIGPTLVAFGTLTAAGALIATGPAWTRGIVVVVAGLVNGWCWLRVTHAVAGRVPVRTGRPFAVVALAGILALVIGGAAGGFAIAAAAEASRGAPRRADPDATGPPVLVVKGFNSSWNGTTLRWVPGDFRIRRFSYAGVDDRGRPRPYGRKSTHASVRTLARRMRAQVEILHRDAGAPVGIVAESEGALVALTYLLATPRAPVDAIVVLSPLPEPGRVSYPLSGRVGWGIGAGAALDAVAALVDGLGPIEVHADTPLLRSIVEEAPLFAGLVRCPVPGVRQLAVLPFDTGLAAPVPAAIEIPYVVRPAFHGGLLGDEVTARLTARALRGQRVSSSPAWRATESAIQAAASPWQVPSLAKSLEPTWRDLPDPDDCAAVRRALRTYVGP